MVVAVPDLEGHDRNLRAGRGFLRRAAHAWTCHEVATTSTESVAATHHFSAVRQGKSRDPLTKSWERDLQRPVEKRRAVSGQADRYLGFRLRNAAAARSSAFGGSVVQPRHSVYVRMLCFGR
jgi:hypothetical protein